MDTRNEDVKKNGYEKRFLIIKKSGKL